MIDVNCPACGRVVQVDEMRGGSSQACIHCSTPFTIPGGPPPPKQKSNVGLVVGIIAGSLLCVCGAGIVAAIAIPGVMRAKVAANERIAAASLKQVAVAEDEFRLNDADGNRVLDYWTANLAGLHCLRHKDTGAAVGTLADLSIAAADIDRDNAAAKAYSEDKISYDASMLPVASPKSGYAFQALRNDFAGTPFADDTDATNRKVHSTTGFGFMALPVAWDETGSFVLIVDADGSVYRRDFGASTSRVVFGVPVDTFDGSQPADFPGAATLGASWMKEP